MMGQSLSISYQKVLMMVFLTLPCLALRTHIYRCSQRKSTTLCIPGIHCVVLPGCLAHQPELHDSAWVLNAVVSQLYILNHFPLTKPIYCFFGEIYHCVQHVCLLVGTGIGTVTRRLRSMTLCAVLVHCCN